MLSDWPSLYMKAVSSSVWPRSRKARTAAALDGASIRRPISMVPSTVSGRTGEPEAARGGRDMAAALAVQACGGPGLRAQRTAARATARDTALSIRSAPARWGTWGSAHSRGAEVSGERGQRVWLPFTHAWLTSVAPATVRKDAAREEEPQVSGAGPRVS